MSFTWHGSSLLNHNLLYRVSLCIYCVRSSRLCNICNECSCSMLSVNFISINSTVLTCVKWASHLGTNHLFPLVFVRKYISSETIPTLNLLVLFVILLVLLHCVIVKLLRSLWSLSAIFRTSLFSVSYTSCIKCTTDNVISCTW